MKKVLTLAAGLAFLASAVSAQNVVPTTTPTIPLPVVVAGLTEAQIAAALALLLVAAGGSSATTTH